MSLLAIYSDVLLVKTSLKKWVRDLAFDLRRCLNYNTVENLI